MSRFPWILLFLLLAGTVGGAVWYVNNEHKEHDVVVKDDKLPPRVISIGFVDTSVGIAKLSPQQSGRVLEIVDEGKFVNKGDALLKLDDSFVQFEKDQAEADVQAATAQLEQAKLLRETHQNDIEIQEAKIDAIKNDREKLDRAIKNRIDLSGSELSKIIEESMKNDLKKLDATIKGEQSGLAKLKAFDPETEIKKADAALSAKQATLKKASKAVEECVLRAPSAGLVLRVNAHVGETIGPSFPGAIQFAAAGPDGQVNKIVRAEVVQEWASGIHVGQSVTIEDDTQHAKGEAWQGKIKEIAKWIGPKRVIIAEPFMINDVRTLECVIEIKSEGPRPLLIGQRVRATIDTSGVKK